ncbi:uncharacterized protein LOC110033546 [Phalaenopsis equestris]|uniref:uncharacterized protein LOC110033546 n=1 Tax=Phalaenopsis equestris TaxID=78828 RepID=UPI0009E356F5|nr:uncharacterized protein LOC110033546 [Phalaenopsis equestris]
MGSLESSGEATLGFKEIRIAAESLSRSDMFHLVKELLGFILYTHHQIPAVLQHLEHEFNGLKEDYKQLELLHSTGVERKEKNIYFHRKANMRKNEVKSSIKKLEKLMSSISTLFSALQEAIDGIPDFHGVTFLLGGSPARPQHVYEIFFSHFGVNSDNVNHITKSKVAEALSRKVVRALMSNDAGSSISGPTKLFLMIKCPCTFNLPLHFLPKRDFRCNKKVLPFKLHIKSKMGDQIMKDLHYNSGNTNSSSLADMVANDMIWYQCRHAVKGLAFKSHETDC